MTGRAEYPEGMRADGLPAVLSDPDRLAALAASGQSGRAPEQVFDDLARLAASVTSCGISAITFVGETRTFWKPVPHLPYGPGPIAERGGRQPGSLAPEVRRGGC